VALDVFFGRDDGLILNLESDSLVNSVMSVEVGVILMDHLPLCWGTRCEKVERY